MKKTNILLTFFVIFSCIGCTGLFPKKEKPKDMKSEFVGIWKTTGTDKDGKSTGEYYITLSEDGSAKGTWKGGETGTWKVVAERAECEASNGWRVYLYKDCNSYQKLGYAPNVPLDQQATNRAKAEKVKSIPPTKAIS